MNIRVIYLYLYLCLSLSLYIYIHVHSRRFKNWYLWLNYRALARKTFLEGKKPCLSMYMHSKTSGYLVIPLISHPKWMVFIRYFFSGLNHWGVHDDYSNAHPADHPSRTPNKKTPSPLGLWENRVPQHLIIMILIGLSLLFNGNSRISLLPP